MLVYAKTIKQLYKIQKVLHANRNFLFLWAAQIFTQSAVSIASINVGILSHEGILAGSTKGSSLSIGFIIFLAVLPGLFFAPIAGVIADWYSKKKIMIASNVLRFLILFTYVLFVGWKNVWLSYALIFVLSVVLQFFIPAEGGTIPRIVKKKYILLANSLFSFTVYSTFGVGVILSGLFLTILGTRVTFILCSIFFIISSLLLTRIRLKERERGGRSFGYFFDFIPHLLREVKNGIMYSFGKLHLRFALLHLFAIQIIGLTIVTLIFRIGDEIYGVSSLTAGVVIVAPMVVGLLSGLASMNIVGRKRSRVNLIWLGSILSSIGFLLMLMISAIGDEHLFTKRIIATSSLLLIGLSFPFLLVPAQTLIYENTKPAFRGRVLGVWLALTSSLASLVAIFMGFISDRIGRVSIAILIIVILDISYSILLYYLFKKRRL